MATEVQETKKVDTNEVKKEQFLYDIKETIARSCDIPMN